MHYFKRSMALALFAMSSLTLACGGSASGEDHNAQGTAQLAGGGDSPGTPAKPVVDDPGTPGSTEGSDTPVAPGCGPTVGGPTDDAGTPDLLCNRSECSEAVLEQLAAPYCSNGSAGNYECLRENGVCGWKAVCGL